MAWRIRLTNINQELGLNMISNINLRKYYINQYFE